PSATAFDTSVVVATMPTDTNPLSFFPSCNPSAQFIDDAGNFVARNPRILEARPEAFFDKHITVADPARLYFDAHLSRVRVGNGALDDLEINAGVRNLYHFHCSDRDRCCHSSSPNVSYSFQRELARASSGTLTVGLIRRPLSSGEPLRQVH